MEKKKHIMHCTHTAELDCNIRILGNVLYKKINLATIKGVWYFTTGF